jgi:tRNA(fMet)-specific endonuclease VapC
MILLDTDHVSVLQIREGQRTQQLKDRLAAAGDPVVGTTIISVEEQMRGWLAAIAKERQPKRQIAAYRNLAELFEFFRNSTSRFGTMQP